MPLGRGLSFDPPLRKDRAAWGGQPEPDVTQRALALWTGATIWT